MVGESNAFGVRRSCDLNVNPLGDSSGRLPGEPAATPPVELRDTLEALGQDLDLFKELVEIFLDQYPKQLHILHDHLESGSAPQFGEAAHSIKGSVGNFRAHRAWNIAYRLEQMGKEGNLREAGLVLNELEEELTRVKGFLEKALQGPSS